MPLPPSCHTITHWRVNVMPLATTCIAHELNRLHCKKKDGDWYIYPQFLAHENPKNAQKLIKTHRKVIKTSNLAYTMFSVQGRISHKKYSFHVCLLAVLGSQGIVVKCTAAICFLTADYINLTLFNPFHQKQSSE